MQSNQTPLRFDGADYQPDRDTVRLTAQIGRIYTLMRDGQWRTLDDIARQTGDPQASVSAQLRHLRKTRFGAHTVQKEYLHEGLYRYRMLVNPLALPHETAETGQKRSD